MIAIEKMKAGMVLSSDFWDIILWVDRVLMSVSLFGLHVLSQVRVFMEMMAQVFWLVRLKTVSCCGAQL